MFVGGIVAGGKVAFLGWTIAADANDGVVSVRDDSSRTIEVLVRRRFAFRRLWVDREGQSGLASTAPAGLRPLSRHVRLLEQRGETWLCVNTAEPRED